MPCVGFAQNSNTAEENSLAENLSIQDLNTEETQQNPVCVVQSSQQDAQPSAMMGQQGTSPSIPRYENNLFFKADFLYWSAKQEGNQYATTGSAITVPGTSDPNTFLTAGAVHSGKVYAPSSEMKPGVRASIGIDLRHGGWDLLAEYTYLYNDAHDSVSSTNLNSGILPLFSYIPNNSILSQCTFAAVSGATGFISSAHAQWTFHFNNLNLELGKNMDLFSFLSLRPHFGLQGTLQEQHFSALYKVSSITDVDVGLGKNRVLFNQDSWGVGLRLGLDSAWRCCNHLSLFVNSAASALWGAFDAHARSYDTDVTAGYDDVLIAKQTNYLHSISPVLELEAGVQSDWAFCNKYRFLMQVGWDEQVWFFQNQHSSIIANTSLVLQGLTVNFRFDF
jgi:hypothetical protein